MLLGQKLPLYPFDKLPHLASSTSPSPRINVSLLVRHYLVWEQVSPNCLEGIPTIIMLIPHQLEVFPENWFGYQSLEGIQMLHHAGAILIPESHYLPEYWDFVDGILVFEHFADFLPKDPSSNNANTSSASGTSREVVWFISPWKGSSALPCWSHLDTGVPLSSGILRLCWWHSCFRTFCWFSSKGCPPWSLHWSL